MGVDRKKQAVLYKGDMKREWFALRPKPRRRSVAASDAILTTKADGSMEGPQPAHVDRPSPSPESATLASAPWPRSLGKLTPAFRIAAVGESGRVGAEGRSAKLTALRSAQPFKVNPAPDGDEGKKVILCRSGA